MLWLSTPISMCNSVEQVRPRTSGKTLESWLGHWLAGPRVGWGVPVTGSLPSHLWERTVRSQKKGRHWLGRHEHEVFHPATGATTPPHSEFTGPSEADPIPPPSWSGRKHRQAEQRWVYLGSPVRTSGNDKLALHRCGRMSAWSFWEVPVEDSFLGRRPIQKKSRVKRRERDRDLLTLNPWVQPGLKPYTPGPSIHVIIAARRLLTPAWTGLLSLAITTSLD